MPTREDVEQLRAANAGISTLVRSDLTGFWGSLDLNKPEQARDAFLTFAPYTVDKYGTISANMAADWYAEERSKAGVVGLYTAQTAPNVSALAVQSEVRYSAVHLFTDTAIGMLNLLSQQMDLYSLQPGRDTIAMNAENERIKWARVPVGSKTCAFCLSQAARGFVYNSKQKAGGGNKYHGDCDCIPTPDWSLSPRLSGYDPDELNAIYLEAREDAESTRLDGSGTRADHNMSILQALRRNEGIN